MKITIELTEEEVQPLMEEHFMDGVPVQQKIRKALKLWNHIQAIRKDKGKTITFGYGDAQRFKQYNTVIDFDEV